jgi:uncharacterized small protein (DUF1192 family)
MIKWNEFKNHVSKATKKAAVKTKDFADITSLKFKLKSLEIKLCEEYEVLGKLYYSQTIDKNDNQSNIDDKILQITEVKLEITALSSEISEAKAKAKAKKEAEKSQKQADSAKEDDTTKVYEAAPQPPENEETTEEAQPTEEAADKDLGM